MQFIHADESGISESKKAVDGDCRLDDFEWIKIDGKLVELTNQPLHSIYDQCLLANRAVLKWESAFADYTAEFRKKSGIFVITRRGNGYA